MEEALPTKPSPDSPATAPSSPPLLEDRAPIHAPSADAAEEASFGDILQQFEQEQGRAPQDVGQTVEGVVISLTEEAAYVDVRRKLEGVLTLEGSKQKLKAGDRVQVTITGRDSNGYYVLTTVKVVTPVDWSGLEKAFAEKSTISGTVVEVIKGGLRVDVGVPAFMPASRSGVRDVPELDKLVGQQIECRITKLDTASEDVVVDRRVVMEEIEAKARQAAFDAIEEGAVITATVRNVTDFGAFVDLGGFDGLLHVADMTWDRGVKPSEVVKAGDSVRVKVLKINRQTRKISLGMKQLTEDPWVAAAESVQAGQRVRGKVVRVTDFGAFVQIVPGVEGLIHVSEMSWSRKQKKPSEIVRAGEMVDAIVLAVNPGERRIALGLKQALGDPWDEAVARYPKGSVVEAPVSSLTNFGAFVILGDGIDGMIHIGDITRTRRLDHPRELLSAGQVVRAQVTEIDSERRRLRLSMKTLEPTSADTFIAEHQPGDLVTGRLVEVGENRAKVELAEGVTASCKIPKVKASPPTASAGKAKADLSTMTAMLTAKWKGGDAAETRAVPESADELRVGQVRQFRILGLDPSQKGIELEALR